jgi:hypothetical protein
MPMFRKKPVEIEARQVTAANLAEIAEWCGGLSTADMTWDYDAGCYKHPTEGFVHGAQYLDQGVVIRTLEGDMFGRLDDWIIRGVQGEFYPCKPDIFDATYEPKPVAR